MQTWVELLVNAPDRVAAERFAERLTGLLPLGLTVKIGPAPAMPAGSTQPCRHVASVLVGCPGGTIATKQAAQAAVDKALSDSGLSIDTVAQELLDMTVVVL